MCVYVHVYSACWLMTEFPTISYLLGPSWACLESTECLAKPAPLHSQSTSAGPILRLYSLVLTKYPVP